MCFRPQLGRVLSFLVIMSFCFATFGSFTGWAYRGPRWQDETPPTVRFGGLHQYSLSTRSTPIVISASDDVGISRIELYVDHVLAGVQDIAPTAPNILVSFNWGSASRGRHILVAQAFDASGNSSSTISFVRLTDSDPQTNQAPVVSAGIDKTIRLRGAS